MTVPVPEIFPYLWLIVRAGGFMLWWPLAAGTWMPSRMKIGLTLGLALMAASQIEPGWAAGAEDALITTAIGEFLIGLWMGFGTRLTFVLLEVGGHIIAMEMGLAMAQNFNPASQSTATVIETWAYFWGICLAVVTGWYRDSIGYWILSFRHYPPGDWWSLSGGVAGLPKMMAAVFAMGVQMAAPVIALILLLNLTFAFLGKVAPQVNVLMLSFAVRIGLGLAALGVVVILARTLFLDASSWILPYTVNPSAMEAAN